jgi:hypothetical protein
LKKVVAAAVAVVFAFVYSGMPVLAGEGPMSMDNPAGSEPAGSTEMMQSTPPPPMTGTTERNEKLAGLMSLAVPCTGQWYNGELKTWKTAAMATIEAGSIFVLAFFAAGGAGDDAKMVCMAGAGGMIANHLWSGWDAWNTAKKKNQGLAMGIDQNRAMVSYNVPF